MGLFYCKGVTNLNKFDVNMCLFELLLCYGLVAFNKGGNCWDLKHIVYSKFDFKH